MSEVPVPVKTSVPQPAKLYSLEEAKKELIRVVDAEYIEREEALDDIRRENFSMLHEDEPTSTWIKYVPIGCVILEVVIIILLFVKK